MKWQPLETYYLRQEKNKMAIKATKQGEQTRWIVFSLFANAGDYEKLVVQHAKEGWNLEHGFDYADVVNLYGGEK